MSRKSASDSQKAPPKPREDKLKAALKANMARRKAQAKAREALAEQSGKGDKG